MVTENMTAKDTSKDTSKDIEAIKQLKARYFRLMDTKAWADFENVFTDDVVMDMSGEAERQGRNPKEGIHEGKKAIRESLEHLIGNAVTVHQGYMPEITILDEETAEGIWAMSDYVDFGEDSKFRGIRGTGHYYETYKKVGGKKTGGEWKIQHIKLVRLTVFPI